MKRTIWIALAGCVMLALSGCKKEERYELTAIDKKMIPYKLGDTIRFIDERGLVATLPVVEDKTEWDEGHTYTSPVSYERRSVWLKSGSGDNYKSLILWVSAWDLSQKTERCLFFYLYNHHFHIYYDSEGRFRTDNKFQYQHVYDSMEVNRKIYYNVCLVRDWSDACMQLYYSTDYGILQVTQNDKNVFSLIP